MSRQKRRERTKFVRLWVKRGWKLLRGFWWTPEERLHGRSFFGGRFIKIEQHQCEGSAEK